jgi:hypothetical protein
MKGEAKVTLPKAYCISLPHDTVIWTCIVFTRVLFWLHVSFLSVMDGKLAQWNQSLWLTWLWLPILLTRRTWPPVTSLFPKLKMNLKGRFETVPDIERELQAVLDSIKENYFQCLWNVGEMKRFYRGIRFQWNYFEGDCSQNWVSYASIYFLT